MALDIYLANTDVTLVIPLVDTSGNAITVDSVSYRVIDHTGAEIVAMTVLDMFVSGDLEAHVLVPAVKNALSVSSSREVRSVELLCVSAGNTLSITKSYGLESTAPLVVGVNSFQTLAVAEMTALDIPKLTAWDSSDESEKTAALIEARERIHRLNFNLLNSNINFGQDSLAYIPEGSFPSQYVGHNGLFMFNGNLGLLNAAQYNVLPERFKRALRQAQVTEANFILGGDTGTEMRQAGIVSDTVGESSQQYRPGKPLEMPICKAALGYLSYFVTFGKRIGRG